MEKTCETETCCKDKKANFKFVSAERLVVVDLDCIVNQSNLNWTSCKSIGKDLIEQFVNMKNFWWWSSIGKGRKKQDKLIGPQSYEGRRSFCRNNYIFDNRLIRNTGFNRFKELKRES